MLQKLSRVLAAFVAVGFMGAIAISANAEDKKDPTAKEIMKHVNAKQDGLLAKTSSLSKEGKWEDAAKVAKELKEDGIALGKAKPKKGEDDSWKKLTKAYAERTAAIAAAVDKKDNKEVEAAVKEFGAGGKHCMECHKAHK